MLTLNSAGFQVFLTIKIISLNKKFIDKDPVNKGQGLGLIIWNGWCCDIICCYSASLTYIDSSIVNT